MYFLNHSYIKKESGKRLLCVVFYITGLLLLNFRANAQQYYFQHYNIEDGLGQSQIKTIYQDDNRYLWLGTQSGVSRFDGTDFVNYAKIDGINGNIVSAICQNNDEILLRTGIGISFQKDNKIQKRFVAANEFYNSYMLKDHKGAIWLINGYQLSVFKNNKLSAVTVVGKKDTALTIALDNEKKICVAIAGKGIFCLDGNQWVKKVELKDQYKNLYIQKIIFDRLNDHRIYLLAYRKLYEADNGVINPYQNKLLEDLSMEITSLAQDRNGHLWVGTMNAGAYYLNGDSSIHFTNNNGFTNSAVTDIYCDNEDITWLATNGDGLYKFQGSNVTSYTKINGNPLQAIAGLAQDEFNNIWAGTSGDGLLLLKKDHFDNIFLPTKNPLAKYIFCISYKEKQPLLISTADGLWTFDKGKFSQLDEKDPKSIYTVTYDENNKIWIGASSGCYYLEKGIFQKVKNLNKIALTLTSIGKDSILAGTHFGIKLIVNGRVDEGFKFHQLDNSTIMSVVKTGNLLIIGTLGEGIYLVDASKHWIKNFSVLNGLRSNDVYSMLDAGNNIIWAGTGKGLEKLRLDQKELSFTEINDIVPNPFVESDNDAILSLNNKIWLGTSKGLFVYDLSKNLVNNKSKLPVINIENIKVINQQEKEKKEALSYYGSELPQGLKLNYDQNRIIISFKGMYFTDPGNLRYQYRLIGLEDNFSAPSKLNQADYTSLAPGTYQFEVRAVTAQGTMSDTEQISIEISPAFYQTTLFYVLVAILIIGLIISIQEYLTYRKNVQRLLLERLKREEQIRIREQTAEDFHDDIGNKLTRIMILTDTLKQKTQNGNNYQKELIDQIQENANTLYTGTKDILWALDPQNENLFEIYSYIKNLAVDIFANTDVELVFREVDFKQNKFELPLEFSRNISMIFREILHNILKHAEASRIEISCTVNEDYFSIGITDDGKGFDTGNDYQGRGLKNMRSRAEKINGVVNIVSIPGKGTKIKLRFVIDKV